MMTEFSFWVEVYLYIIIYYRLLGVDKDTDGAVKAGKYWLLNKKEKKTMKERK